MQKLLRDDEWTLHWATTQKKGCHQPKMVNYCNVFLFFMGVEL